MNTTKFITPILIRGEVFHSPILIFLFTPLSFLISEAKHSLFKMWQFLGRENLLGLVKYYEERQT